MYIGQIGTNSWLKSSWLNSAGFKNNGINMVNTLLQAKTQKTQIQPKTRRVLRDNKEVSLTPKEFDILYFLAKNKGNVFTKEQIYKYVWEDDYFLADSNIMAFIRKLRKKIEPNPDEPEYIITIWGIGYKFNDKL